jgi:hypothetical protein
MKELLISLVGKIWDTWILAGEDHFPKQTSALTSLWNEYMVGDWSNWTTADCVGVAVCIPTNNTQERWHLKLTKELRGQMRASLGKVLEQSIPKMMRADGRCAN